MSSKGPIIQVERLTKIYKVGQVEVPALRGIDLEIQPGEFVCVLGPSGSGKSTLFHIIGGLTHPSSGRVFIEGQDIFQLPDIERTRLRRRKIGFVFQRYNLLPTLTARDNILIARYLAGNTNHDLDEDFQELLDYLGIENRLNHKPSALSGGEQQRVAIARALINKPAILLADEPTGNLDTENSRNVLNLLKGLNRRIGQTILLITHEPAVASYADRILHIRDGQLMEQVDWIDL